MSISFIIPTMGRPSLYATLHSLLRDGAGPDDEVIVVADGEQPEARRIVSCFRERLPISYHKIEDGKCVGGPHRNLGMKVATKNHLSFMDDDDVYAPGAIRNVRAEVARNPEKVLIFRMKGLTRRLTYEKLWRTTDLVLGNLGTPMFVVPNVKSKLGQWSREYFGDFDFISSTVHNFGIDKLVWVDEIIAHVY